MKKNRANHNLRAGKPVRHKPAPVPRWLAAFGGLRHLRNETRKINRILHREFDQIAEDEWH